MQDNSDAHAHFGWFKRRRHLKVDEITVVDKPMLKRAVGAAALGNAMEWFDFGVYGYLAVTIGQVFFPSSNPTAQVIAAFATFTVAFLVRPLGGMVFGPLGDRYGRQKVLAFTMIMMALGTFAIGLIPSYERIGIWAPVLLLLARVVQGFSTGGEYGGAATFIAEYSTDRNRGLMGSWLEFGTLGGYIAGAGTVTALHMLLSSEQMLDWGWRIPFLLAAPLGLGGLYMRRNMEDSSEFKKLKQTGRLEKAPLRKSLSTSSRALLFCTGFVVVKAVSSWVLQSFMPGYLSTHLHYSKTDAYLITTLGLLSVAVCMPITGYLSDIWGRRPLMLMGCGGFILLTYPAMLVMSQGSVGSSIAAMSMLGIFVAMFNGGCGAAMVELFPTAIRYGSIAIAYNLTVAIFGGVTPLASASLISLTGDPLSPAWYVMITALISFIAVWLAKETAGKVLD